MRYSSFSFGEIIISVLASTKTYYLRIYATEALNEVVRIQHVLKENDDTYLT